jgi:hypothetical protein
MDEYLTLFEILTLAAGLIGVYTKLTSEVGKLKGRIAMLEKQEAQVMALLEKLVTTCDEIKLILAKEGLR